MSFTADVAPTKAIIVNGQSVSDYKHAGYFTVIYCHKTRPGLFCTAILAQINSLTKPVDASFFVNNLIYRY